MSAKERLVDIAVKKNLSRKQMLARAVAGATLLSSSLVAPYFAEGLDKGLALDLTRSDSKAYIASENEFDISGQQIITFVHRAGNSENGIRNAAILNASFAELGLDKDENDLFAYHGQNFDVKLPGFGKVIEFGLDSEKLELRTGDPNFRIEDAFKTASEVNIGLFIDLKRGDINSSDIKYLKYLSLDFKVPIMLHSGRPDLVDMAILTLIELEKAETNKTLVMDVPADAKAWESFFAKGGRAALTNIRSARKYRERLDAENVFVIVGDAKNSGDIKNSLSIGVVNGFMLDAR